MKIRLFLLATILVSCGTTSSTVDSSGEFEALGEMITQKSFEIESDWAMPMANSAMNQIAARAGANASRINLIGNPNYLKVEGDSVSADLPYFGERQMGGGYNNDGGGIKFEGVPKNYEVIKNDKKKHYEIRFSVSPGSESFSVTATIFPNLSTSINVSSTQRSPISYQGKAKTITKD